MEQLFGLRFYSMFVKTRPGAKKLHIFNGGKLLVKRKILRHKAKQPVYRFISAPYILPKQFDIAFTCRKQACHQADERSFTGAVRAKQPKTRTLRYLKIKI